MFHARAGQNRSLELDLLDIQATDWDTIFGIAYLWSRVTVARRWTLWVHYLGHGRVSKLFSCVNSITKFTLKRRSRARSNWLRRVFFALDTLRSPLSQIRKSTPCVQRCGQETGLKFVPLWKLAAASASYARTFIVVRTQSAKSWRFTVSGTDKDVAAGLVCIHNASQLNAAFACAKQANPASGSKNCKRHPAVTKKSPKRHSVLVKNRKLVKKSKES